MLRDCARGAKIWSKAPRIEEIPDSKWEVFFKLVGFHFGIFVFQYFMFFLGYGAMI